jgi:DNA-binding HxlR family transcriptional regulator
LIREQFAEIPPRVEYELTDRGRSLEAVFDVMAQWGSADQAATQRS